MHLNRDNLLFQTMYNMEKCFNIKFAIFRCSVVNDSDFHPSSFSVVGAICWACHSQSYGVYDTWTTHAFTPELRYVMSRHFCILATRTAAHASDYCSVRSVLLTLHSCLTVLQTWPLWKTNEFITRNQLNGYRFLSIWKFWTKFQSLVVHGVYQRKTMCSVIATCIK